MKIQSLKHASKKWSHE